MAEDKREGDSDDEFDYMRDFTFDDWEYCWSKNKADWNKSFVDPVFQKFFPIAVQKLGLADKELRVLLPLCGKTPDLIWCANLGHSVVGVEYVEQGVREFFEENKFEHETTVHGELKHHQCLKKDLKLSMWQGDFFQCTSDLVGQFDLAWDHGSFTAINTGDRER
jgi:thiopurine S-methyltransferase